MRATTPAGDDDWPHDMVMTIDDSPSALLELLWMREAYDLHPTGDAPPLLVDAPPVIGSADDQDAWELGWTELWHAAVRHAARGASSAQLEAVGNAAVGSPERDRLLRALIGPTWRERFGGGALAHGFLEWSDRRAEERVRAMRRPLEDEPERRSLEALIPAWRAGLSRVVTIPCRGEHTRMVERSALLVTDGTRDDPERYAAALRAFR